MTDIVTGAVIAKIPERISASMAAKSAKRAAKKAAQDAAKAARAAAKAEKATKVVEVAKTAETVEKTEKAAKAVSTTERFYSELDALKLKAREIPSTLTEEEARACEAVKLQMKGELSSAGKVSVEEVGKIDEAVKAASTVRETKDAAEAKKEVAVAIRKIEGTSKTNSEVRVVKADAKIEFELESMDKSSTIVPNPNEKKGSQAHQNVISSIRANNLGGEIHYEVKFDTPNGSKNCRYADAVEVLNGEITSIHQVGNVSKNGMPVVRELRAIADIMASPDYNGAPIYFWPYNSNSGPIIYNS